MVREGVQNEEIGVIPYSLTLDYDYWSSREHFSTKWTCCIMHMLTALGEILSSMLPEEFHDDIPTSFNTAGHVGAWLGPRPLHHGLAKPSQLT